MKRHLTIGTRGSKLALWQTHWVKAQLEAHHPDLRIEIAIISTKGDRVLDVSLPKLGEQGKGLFTKELEEALLAGRADLAVHSLKDLPTEFVEGLQLTAVCEREDPRDALVARLGIAAFGDLRRGAIVGTSSLRRIAQLQALRPDLELVPVRGNVDTRLGKLDAGQYDALILAAAGLKRLGYAHRITECLAEDLMLSAVGQGALGIETRADDAAVASLVTVLDHLPTRRACTAERALLKGLGGGCLVPIAALAQLSGAELTLSGLVASADGAQVVRGKASGQAAQAEEIGQRLADDLLARGAGRLLNG